MTPVARRLRVAFVLLAALPGFTAQALAQEGEATIDGTRRHGFLFTSRPNVSLSFYCGFSGRGEQQVFVYRKSAEGDGWFRVGGCNMSHGRDPDSIAIGDVTMHFIFALQRATHPTSADAGWQGTTMVAREAANDCGIRLRYFEPNGAQARVVLLDPRMAFGHGVPITTICDPLLDHYDHFQ